MLIHPTSNSLQPLTPNSRSLTPTPDPSKRKSALGSFIILSKQDLFETLKSPAGVFAPSRARAVLWAPTRFALLPPSRCHVSRRSSSGSWSRWRRSSASWRRGASPWRRRCVGKQVPAGFLADRGSLRNAHPAPREASSCPAPGSQLVSSRILSLVPSSLRAGASVKQRRRKAHASQGWPSPRPTICC